MQIFEIVRLAVGTGLLLCGLGIFLMELYGAFHFDYVLNRMHAAAMGDTLGISFSLIGLMVFNGLTFTTMKLALIVIFFWIASPISSHMLARLEVTTNDNLRQHCEVYEELSALEEELARKEDEERAKEREGRLS